jgi:tripartite-type tricarboxylate transporter receptor subunit TctC
MATASNATNATFYDTLPFNFQRDTAPVAGLVSYPLVMVVPPAFPAKTVAEFITYAKANPGKIIMASYGTGTSGHLASELFKAMTGVSTVHVPCRGEAVAFTDMLGGQVQMMFATGPGSVEQIKSGKLRALAVSTGTRWEQLPDIPTIGETVAGYEANSWSGVIVPRATPSEVIEKLSHEINGVLADRNIRKRLVEVGTTPMTFGPSAFGKFVGDETDKWAKVIRTANIKLD